MFCSKCGAQIDDNAAFCPVCGYAVEKTTETYTEPTPVEPAFQQPVYQQPVYQQAPVNDQAKTEAAKSAMIMAIIGLVLAELGLPGLILSCIARKKVKNYLNTYGELTGMAKVANILSKVGLALSIVMMVIWVIYIIAMVAIGASGALNNINYYY